MYEIIQALQDNDWTEISNKSRTNQPYTEEEMQAIKEIEKEVTSHITTQISRLATVAKMLAICTEENDIGSFNKADAISMSHFLQYELEVLCVFDTLRSDALFYKETTGAVA